MLVTVIWTVLVAPAVVVIDAGLAIIEKSALTLGVVFGEIAGVACSD
jgi:hypothetical protein